MATFKFSSACRRKRAAKSRKGGELNKTKTLNMRNICDRWRADENCITSFGFYHSRLRNVHAAQIYLSDRASISFAFCRTRILCAVLSSLKLIRFNYANASLSMITATAACHRELVHARMKFFVLIILSFTLFRSQKFVNLWNFTQHRTLWNPTFRLDGLTRTARVLYDRQLFLCRCYWQIRQPVLLLNVFVECGITSKATSFHRVM